MSAYRTHRFLVSALLTTALVAGLSAPSRALAVDAGQVAEKQAELESALNRLEAARERVAQVDARMASTSRRLDQLMDAQLRARARLNARAGAMYRTGETTFVSVLMNSRTYEQFAAGWALLKRINLQDAATIRDLKNARARTATAARELIALQTRAAKDLEAEQQEVAAARKRLADSKDALAEYQRRVAALPSRTVPAVPTTEPEPDPAQERIGSGDWKTAVASHYGRNFTGGSASGERIGPYSMVCAHKTLPFGTLVEFEYEGKRAVARVVDRGPFTPGRTFDLGPGVVRVLDFEGVNAVRYRIIGR